MTSSFLALYVAMAMAPVAPPLSAPPEVVDASHVEQIWVDAGPLDAEALNDDLRLRLPEVGVFTPPTPAPAHGGPLVLFVTVDEAPQGVSIDIVTSDGRGYTRTVSHDPEASDAEARKAVARNVANLVEGIEAGTSVAQREDAPVPVQMLCPVPKRQDPSPPPPLETAPTAVEPAPAPAPAPAPPEALETSAQPSWSMGARVGGGGAAGLGAPLDVQRWLGGGGSIAIAARSPRGWVVGSNARMLTLRDRGPVTRRVVRTRFDLHGGYAWRPAGRSSFTELEVLGGLFVEPWQLRSDGKKQTVPGRVPAVGGWIRVASGVLLGPRSSKLRLGPWVELAAGGVPSNGFNAARLGFESMDQIEYVSRVGGVELSAGLELAVWFALDRMRPHRRF